MSEILKEIAKGYFNLLMATLGLVDEKLKEKRDNKAKLCTSDCPLSNSKLGIGYCDLMKKSHEGIRGCGCIKEAKFWSDSPCPMGKF